VLASNILLNYTSQLKQVRIQLKEYIKSKNSLDKKISGWRIQKVVRGKTSTW